MSAQANANANVTEWLHRLTPAELPYHLFSDRNPLMVPLAGLAKRRKVSPALNVAWPKTTGALAKVVCTKL